MEHKSVNYLMAVQIYKLSLDKNVVLLLIHQKYSHHVSLRFFSKFEAETMKRKTEQ